VGSSTIDVAGTTGPTGPTGPTRRVPEMARSVRAPTQRSFDDMGEPLVGVTFVVFDLETTGATPAGSEITEIGAVKIRGGVCLGTFQTLVNPGLAIPPMITVLTGITDALVAPAPPITEVLPSFLEFIGDAVLVGHNVSFDIGFTDAALVRTGRDRLRNPRVDTLALARRLILDEVPNLKLSTIARHLRATHLPSHRALDDALATADVLHALLERAGSFGITALDDLLALPSLNGSPAVAKLALTRDLPRRPGVYLFRNARGQVVYVGKATNLRTRVRSYFSSETRRKIPQLLRETARIDHIETTTVLEAEVHEIRLIRQHEPHYNRRSKHWRSSTYLKLTTSERFPRLSVVKSARDGDGVYLGPFPSASAAQTAREAIETALPLRRCGRPIGKRAVPGDGATCPASPCVPGQLGVAACPCSGLTDPIVYAAIAANAVRALTDDPALVLDPLVVRMHSLAEQARFEEAAVTRDRLNALGRALRTRREIDAVRYAGRLVVHARSPDATTVSRVVVEHGHLVEVQTRSMLAPARASTPPDQPDQPDRSGIGAGARAGTRRLGRLVAAPEAAIQLPLTPARPRSSALDPVRVPPGSNDPPGRDELEELLIVTRWLQREVSEGRVRLVSVERPMSSALPRIDTFEARRRERQRERAPNPARERVST
jgi:DNA polymerase III subunit epsilon